MESDGASKRWGREQVGLAIPAEQAVCPGPVVQWPVGLRWQQARPAGQPARRRRGERQQVQVPPHGRGPARPALKETTGPPRRRCHAAPARQAGPVWADSGRPAPLQFPPFFSH